MGQLLMSPCWRLKLSWINLIKQADTILMEATRECEKSLGYGELSERNEKN